mmetsp:Transcript_20223/g.52477  ORF Transcript_20223/g.52477 Transcript_20223/m.52477 type:complete len:231 (+) Transcript_20223:999-1691(+)
MTLLLRPALTFARATTPPKLPLGPPCRQLHPQRDVHPRRPPAMVPCSRSGMLKVNTLRSRTAPVCGSGRAPPPSRESATCQPRVTAAGPQTQCPPVHTSATSSAIGAAASAEATVASCSTRPTLSAWRDVVSIFDHADQPRALRPIRPAAQPPNRRAPTLTPDRATLRFGHFGATTAGVPWSQRGEGTGCGRVPMRATATSPRSATGGIPTPQACRRYLGIGLETTAAGC